MNSKLYCVGARWPLRSFYKARIANSCAVFQREVNPAVGVDLRSTFSATIVVGLGHEDLPPYSTTGRDGVHQSQMDPVLAQGVTEKYSCQAGDEIHLANHFSSPGNLFVVPIKM